ncbi:homoserine dehydrogenase [Herbaspirillum sp.]|uniref:homoserine dehydrogenase n=1 Tax=Herbaspirillum sp. TaxID=1890675 RepID=UPI0031D3DACB
MNYELLFKELQDRRIRIALTGANGGFSRTLLVQCRAVANIEIAALCDLDLEGTLAMLETLGIPAASVGICRDQAQVRAAAAAGKIVLVGDHALLDGVALDIVVEATGQPEVSVSIATAAISRGVHVAMVTKETDSAVGPYLNRLALEHGVVYTTVDGDQPSNLIGLVTWARLLGFDIVAAGKSSEYDYIYHAGERQIEYTEQRHAVDGLDALWELGDDVPARLAQRSAALAALPQSATPDYCELNVVCNSTGLLPARDALNYPLCRISELADIFIPREDGGILDRVGVVDVFNCLRRHDEASFGGGVFIVVRCTDETVWKLLQQKGHVVSRRRQYACIYLPYHLMGLESLMSLFSAVLHSRPSGSDKQAVHAVMLARAQRDFKAGEVLSMGGHQHHIADIAPLLVPAAEAGGKAPFYLAANKRLRTNVARGADITVEALELDGSALYDAWKQLPA